MSNTTDIIQAAVCSPESSKISLIIAGVLLIVSEALGLIRSSPYRGILQMLVDALVQLSNLTQPPEEQPSIKDRTGRHVHSVKGLASSLSSAASARSRKNSSYFLETVVSEKLQSPTVVVPVALTASSADTNNQNGQPSHPRLQTV